MHAVVADRDDVTILVFGADAMTTRSTAKIETPPATRGGVVRGGVARGSAAIAVAAFGDFLQPPWLCYASFSSNSHFVLLQLKKW